MRGTLGGMDMLTTINRAGLAVLFAAGLAAPSAAEPLRMPSGFDGFAGTASSKHQVATFDLPRGEMIDAPGVATTESGLVDWAHRETMHAAKARISLRNSAAAGGLASFDRSFRPFGSSIEQRD